MEDRHQEPGSVERGLRAFLIATASLLMVTQPIQGMASQPAQAAGPARPNGVAVVIGEARRRGGLRESDYDGVDYDLIEQLWATLGGAEDDVIGSDLLISAQHEWEDGLTGVDTFVEYRDLLRSVESAAAEAAGVRLAALDDPSRLALNAIVLTTLTPSEARALAAGEGCDATLWAHLVTVAQRGAASNFPSDAGSTRAGTAEVDVLEAIDETLATLNTTVEQSQQTELDDAWPKLVARLTPFGLSSLLLTTYIESIAKGIVTWTKKTALHLLGGGREKQPSLEVLLAAAVADTKAAAAAGASAMLEGGTVEGAQTPQQLPAQLQLQALEHDLYPTLMGRLTLAAEEGIAGAFLEHGVPVPVKLAAQIRDQYTALVDGLL